MPIAAVMGRLDSAFLLAFATLALGPSTPPQNTNTATTTNNNNPRLLWSGGNALLLALAALLAAITRDPRLPVERGDYAPISTDDSDRMPSAKGVGFLALGALLAAITQLSTRVALQRVPPGLLITARLLVAFCLFHPMALAYGGTPALKAIYSPKLWLTMLW